MLTELFESEEGLEITGNGIELCIIMLTCQKEMKEVSRMAALMKAKGIIHAIDNLDIEQGELELLVDIFYEALSD